MFIHLFLLYILFVAFLSDLSFVKFYLKKYLESIYTSDVNCHLKIILKDYPLRATNDDYRRSEFPKGNILELLNQIILQIYVM